MRIPRFLGYAVLFAALWSTSALADTIHGTCGDCVTNGSVLVTSTNPPTFSFVKDGNNLPDSGTFLVVALIPQNENSGIPSLTGTNTGNTTVAAGSALNASAISGSTTVNSVLGIAYLPNNPVSAFLPTTQGFDPGATGYFVYLYNFGAVDFSAGNPSFTANGTVPLGSVFLGILETAEGNVGTPNSEVIVQGKVPEPTSITMLGAGFLLVAGAAFFRRRKGEVTAL